MSLVWHYTTAHSAALILACGEILPAVAGVPARETPAVWFSENARCEPTALKVKFTNDGVKILTMQEQAAAIGLVRFGISASDPRLIPWADVRKALRMSVRMKTALEVSGLKQGASPDAWWAIAGPVSVADLTVEEWTPEHGWLALGGEVGNTEIGGKFR